MTRHFIARVALEAFVLIFYQLANFFFNDHTGGHFIYLWRNHSFPTRQWYGLLLLLPLLK